jgi:hypothetical protein
MARLRGGACLFVGEAFGMGARQLGAAWGFIEVLRRDEVGDDADLGEEGKPARACGGQDEFGAFGRQDCGAII